MLDPKLFKEELVEQRKKEIEKKLTKVGSIVPHRGHTLFSFNKKTYEVKKASYMSLTYKMATKNSQNKRVMLEDDCIYIMALNVKNLMKKLQKAFPENFNKLNK
tara:strand:- start:21906 stop:22217 length:312 start_codon:yes stop_codon:yes gene_type:complete